MKKFKINIKIIGIMLVVTGLLVIVYPYVNNYIYANKNRDAKKELLNKINKNEEYRELSEKLYKKLNEENKKLFENGQKDLKDPFSYEEEVIDLNEYGIIDNTIGFITIPKINIEIPIYLGASKSNMNKGAVHLTQTSYPIGGVNTNSIIAAHRGHQTLRLFNDIEKIEVNDIIYIQNFYEELTYKVVDIKIIEPDEIDKIYIVEGRDLITLMTCHPKYIDNKRYLVIAERENV